MRQLQRAARELELALALPPDQALERARHIMDGIGVHQRCRVTIEAEDSAGLKIKLEAAGFVGSSLPSTSIVVLVEGSGTGSVLQARMSRVGSYRETILFVGVGSVQVAHIDTFEHCLDLLRAGFVDELDGGTPDRGDVPPRSPHPPPSIQRVQSPNYRVLPPR